MLTVSRSLWNSDDFPLFINLIFIYICAVSLDHYHHLSKAGTQLMTLLLFFSFIHFIIYFWIVFRFMSAPCLYVLQSRLVSMYSINTLCIIICVKLTKWCRWYQQRWRNKKSLFSYFGTTVTTRFHRFPWYSCHFQDEIRAIKAFFSLI